MNTTYNNNYPRLVEGNSHIISLETEVNTFNSYDETLKFANSLVAKIKNIAKNKNYHCVGIVGVANHVFCMDTRVLNVESGKCEYSCNLPNFVGDKKHRIYILLIASPNSTLKNDICGYCNNKDKRIKENTIIGTYREKISEIFQECSAIKTINLFSDKLNPWAYDIIRLATAAHHKQDNKKRLFAGYDCDFSGKLCVLKGKKVIFSGYPKIAEYPDEWVDLSREEPRVIYKKCDLWGLED